MAIDEITFTTKLPFRRNYLFDETTIDEIQVPLTRTLVLRSLIQRVNPIKTIFFIKLETVIVSLFTDLKAL